MAIPENFFKPVTAAQPATTPAVPAAQVQGGSMLENAAGAAAASTEAANTPLAGFSKLWDAPTTDQGTKPTGVLPTLTAEQLSTTLANSNFLQSVNPDLLAKAAGGDAAAFSDVINQGLRNVMTQSVLASHGLVEAGARSHGASLQDRLPSMVRSSNVSDSLQSNPLYNNPAVRPVIDNVRQQLEAKHPTASAKEIATLTDSYFSDLVSAMGGSKTAATPHMSIAAEGETDWYKELGLDGR